MVNTLTAASPKYWSQNAGRKFLKTIMFRAITDFSEESLLKGDGRIADRPYRSDVVAEKYVKGTAATAQDLSYTSDELTIDQFIDVLMYVDDIDRLQNKYNTVRLWSEEAGQRMAIVLDADILYEAVNGIAANEIDASELGGTLTEGISLTYANVGDIFGEVNEKLDGQNIPEDERYIVVSPLFYNKLWQFLGGKETQLGDKSGLTGNVGQYGGLQIFKSNNLTGVARWTPADDPTAAATIVIEGITFTFQTTIGSTAGNVLAGTNTATTIDNLVALINNGGATSDVGVSNVSLSLANRRAVQQWVAYDGTTYIEVRVKGTPSLTVTSSEAADTWDAKYKVQNLLAGRKIAISAAVQTDPLIDVGMASTISAGKRGTNVMPLLVYGKKTYNVGTTEISRIEIRTDS